MQVITTNVVQNMMLQNAHDFAERMCTLKPSVPYNAASSCSGRFLLLHYIIL